VNTAPIKWAQRTDSLYLTIALPGTSPVGGGACTTTSTCPVVVRGWSCGDSISFSPCLPPALHTLTPTDVKDETIQLTDKELHFKGKSNNKDYEVNIAFFKKVDSEGSTYKVLPRSVQMLLQKAKDDQDEFWPRLLEDKALEKNQVKIDWDRYVDEDEEEEGFDTSNLDGGMGMGGPPGMGGMPPGMDMEALMKQMVGSSGGVLGGRMDEWMIRATMVWDRRRTAYRRRRRQQRISHAVRFFSIQHRVEWVVWEACQVWVTWAAWVEWVVCQIWTTTVMVTMTTTTTIFRIWKRQTRLRAIECLGQVLQKS